MAGLTEGPRWARELGATLTAALPTDVPATRWSVMVRDADTGTELAARDADQVLRTASVGKVLLLLEAARALEAGQASADEPLTWRAEEFVRDSGLWYRMATRTLGLADLCLLTAAVSDNLATNVLVRRFGVEAVAATAATCGVTESALLDRVREERTPDIPWTLSVGCAREYSDLMGRLERGEAVSPAVCARVRGWLTANVDLASVPRHLALDPLGHAPADEPEYALFNKTGSISVVKADVGVLRGERGALAYACLAEWDEDVPDPHATRRAVLAAMARLGEALAAAVG